MLGNTSPNTMTIIPTYRCTAACRECCFESNPSLTKRLEYSQIIHLIDQASQEMNDLSLIVFSGGECFTLKDDLFNSINHATSLGFKTRCITNGYWGKDKKNSIRVAKKIADCGLSEINFSTGYDHAKFVNVNAVINAAIACCEHRISTLILVEKDTSESSIRKEILSAEEVKKAISTGYLKVVSNSWMPFHQGYDDRGIQIASEDLETGCTQIFQNITITPHGRISSCCGLTFEHIPEMKIGNIWEHSLKQAYISQLDDFLKIWIKVDGPYKIIKKLMGEKYLDSLGNISHNCQACVYLHKDKKIVDKVKSDYKKYMPSVLYKYNSMIAIDKLKRNRGKYDYL